MHKLEENSKKSSEFDNSKLEYGIQIHFFFDFLNELGPLHEYVPPPVDVSEIVWPGQYGPSLLAVAVGLAFTVTLVVVVELHPLLVTVTV